MPKLIDLTGKKFGKLTVVKRDKDIIISNKPCVRWLCKCDCGSEVVVLGASLKSGNTKSCGCLYRSEENRLEKSKRFRTKNTYDLSGEYGIGYTTKGEKFYFDLEDYDLIKDYHWFSDKDGYIKSDDKLNKQRNLLMHRLVMNCPSNMIIDHIKHNIKDNRKSELRIVTHSENNKNQCMKLNNTSGVTGVSFDKNTNKWNAYITVNYKRINVGYYKSFEDALRARKEAEEKYFGEYSYDNSMKGV